MTVKIGKMCFFFFFFFFPNALKVFFSWSLVLSWDGELSAVSRDAVEDARNAKYDTVIDEWDEDFDRGKVRGAEQYCTYNGDASVICLFRVLVRL